MAAPFLLFATLAAILALAILAKQFKLPYPIVFVLGGGALAFVPGLPPVRIAPEWIFFAVLPPLLFAGGWDTDWTLFRGNLRLISLLAVGLVVLTTAGVAVAIELLVPGFGWASAFVLGAIVSPPDAVAAGAVFERYAIPRRVRAVLDGEGLVNDGTALVIYRFAVAAAVTGTFSLVQASTAFVVVVLGGIVAGLAIAAAIELLARFLRKIATSDSLINNLVMLLAPYVAYLSGESLHVSGVLAAVTAGIVAGRRSSVILDPESRLLGVNVWNLMIFVLNAFVFLLIGLEVRTIVQDGALVARWLPPALAISACAIALRIVWVVPSIYVPRWISPALRARDPLPPGAWTAIVAWTGLRGIVSLAAALSLPFVDAAGRPFPQRDAIVFVTFVVIVVTLVGQGLSLIPFLRIMGIGENSETDDAEIRVRVKALEAGLARLGAFEREATTPERWETLGRAQAEYRNRIEHLRHHGSAAGSPESESSRFDHELQEEAIAAERHAIALLRDAGKIPDDIFRKVQYDLDLAQSRLV